MHTRDLGKNSYVHMIGQVQIYISKMRSNFISPMINAPQGSDLHPIWNWMHPICTPGEAKMHPSESEMHPIYGTLLNLFIIPTFPV